MIDFIRDGIAGHSFFDIGPGFGDSMDVARQAGATRTGFADIDPAFFVLNRLKGHQGFLGNFLKGAGLSVVPPNSFDHIMSRGAIIADHINRVERGILPFSTILDQIDTMWTGHGTIILNCTFDRGMVPGMYYKCRDREALLKSLYGQTLIDRGYEPVFIPEFNQEDYFPYSFVKRGS